MAKQVRSSSRYVLTTEANVLTAEGTSRVARTTQQTQTAVRASVSIPGLADPAARALSLTTPPPSPPRPAGTPACDPTQGTPASMDDPLARCDCDCHGYESSAGIMRPAYDAMKIGPGFLQCEHSDGANGYRPRTRLGRGVSHTRSLVAHPTPPATGTPLGYATP